MDTSTAVGADGVARLAIIGEIDLQVRDRLADMLRDLLTSERSVEVDLGGVTFLDSSGIGALVHAYHRAAADGRGFRVIGARGTVLRVLKLTGVDQIFADGVQPTIG